MLGNFTYSGPPEVRQAFEDLVADRDRLQAGVQGTVLAIESILTDDHHDMGVSTGEILGRVSAALRARLDPIEAVTHLERERFARQAVDQALYDAVTERDRLRVVVRKLVHELGVEVKESWLTYCYDEFSAPLPFDADELTAYQSALDATPTGEDT